MSIFDFKIIQTLLKFSKFFKQLFCFKIVDIYFKMYPLLLSKYSLKIVFLNLFILVFTHDSIGKPDSNNQVAFSFYFSNVHEYKTSSYNCSIDKLHENRIQTNFAFLPMNSKLNILNLGILITTFTRENNQKNKRLTFNSLIKTKDNFDFLIEKNKFKKLNAMLPFKSNVKSNKFLTFSKQNEIKGIDLGLKKVLIDFT